jgi:hypothetical protein
LALKDIHDRSLNREQFDSFEEYLARRWGISRPRGYELCAAAEVVEDLSATADIQVLPENVAHGIPAISIKFAAKRGKGPSLGQALLGVATEDGLHQSIDRVRVGFDRRRNPQLGENFGRFRSDRGHPYCRELLPQFGNLKASVEVFRR